MKTQRPSRKPTPSKVYPEATKEALELAYKLGKRAARADTWMKVTMEGIEEHLEFGDFQTFHRESWEQTDHFQCGWLEEIIKISEADANKQNVFMHTGDHMTWYEGFNVPCKESFWEGWEEVNKFDAKVVKKLESLAFDESRRSDFKKRRR